MSTVDDAKALLAAEGYVVLKEKSYLAAQERQRIAQVRMEDAQDRVADLDRWAREDLIPSERHMRSRLNFVYGVAVAHGATAEDLMGFECDCGKSGCTVGKPLPSPPPSPPCFCGRSADRNLVHRAQACVPWVQRQPLTTPLGSTT